MISWVALAVAVLDLAVLVVLAFVAVVVSRKARPLMQMFNPPKQ